MDYDLKTEGFSIDEELREALLLRCRKVVLGVGSGHAVRVSIRQIEGRVQGRIEINLPGRRVSAVVWRSDPLEAMESAAQAIIEAADQARRVTGGLLRNSAIDSHFSSLQ